MLSMKTCEQMYSAYREIAVAENLLQEMNDLKEKYRDRDKNGYLPLKDVFGRESNLSLGIPCGKDSQKLVDVHPILAEAIISAHINNKKAELLEINERARVEIDMKEER